jgi:hypothetical protein
MSLYCFTQREYCCAITMCSLVICLIIIIEATAEFDEAAVDVRLEYHHLQW